MKYISAVALFILICILPYNAHGQNPRPDISIERSDAGKLLKSARKEFDHGNYDKALEKYRQLLQMDSVNAIYNFEMAQTYYSSFRQPLASPYFEKAIKFSKDTLGEAYYLLANAYHLDGQFDKAQTNYRIYQQLLNTHGSDLSAPEENDLKEEVSHKIESCDNGKMLSSTPPKDKFTIHGHLRSFQILSLGNNINSPYDDYGCILSANDSIMYFTSRRDGTIGGLFDWDDKYFEDIYMSEMGSAGWKSCRNINPPINTKLHEAVISLSQGGDTLYFYRGLKEGTFFFSVKQDNKWSSPIPFLNKQNVRSNYSDASFFGYAASGNELYVVSKPDTGKSGRDIYVAKKNADGAWGALTNLGYPINTKYDDAAPFITQDGKTMYFSSKGHNSMGGYDIFKSERNGDKWSEPVNLGIPFNTPGDDIYFIIANKSDKAYYSSSGKASDGTKDMDIYVVDMCDTIPETNLAGVTFGIPKGTISVFEKEGNKKIGEYEIQDGKYSITLKHGVNYAFSMQVPSVIEPVSFDVSIPKLCKVYNLYQEIDLSPSSQSLLIRNAFFDIKEESASGDYHAFITKMDKSKFPLYSELTMPIISVVLAKADTATSISSTHSVLTTNASSGTSSTVTTITMNDILFDFNKSNLKTEFFPDLDKVVNFLKNGNKNAKIKVIGHTDSKGAAKYNFALSKRRANAVTAYLASKGISRNRIITIGEGEAKPIAANENPDGSDNPEGRAKNRRTEIEVTR